MEENKYYTPEINEFYVGFEFEDSYGDEEYAKNSIDQLNIKDVISSFLEKEAHIRVKCLDKEDLIELGFKEIGQEEYYLNGDLNSWCIEAIYNQSIKSYYRIDDGETQRMFLEIKNKSELIKVLKMLGVK